jgi:hypothetical protein
VRFNAIMTVAEKKVFWDVTLCTCNSSSIFRRIVGEIYQTTRRHISEDSLHYRNYIVTLFSQNVQSEIPMCVVFLYNRCN